MKFILSNDYFEVNSGSYGVRPALILPSETLVDGSFKVMAAQIHF